MTIPPAIAQDESAEQVEALDLVPVPDDQVVGPFKIDDGSYVGTVTQSFRALRGAGPITIMLHRDGSGPASFVVTDETLVGEWSMSDSGGLSELNNPGFIEATTVGSASGTLSGSFPYTFAGTFISDVSATVDPTAIGPAPVGAQSADGNGSVELSFEFSESVQVCGQVQANWDASMRTFYTGLGWDPYVKTQLVAFPAVDDDTISERLVDLVEEATYASNQMATADPVIELMIGALISAEALMSDIDSYPQTCPLNPEFLRVINQVLRDMINTLVDNWAAQEEFPRALTLRRLAEVGHRAGILGSGAVDPQAAAFLRDKITSILQSSFDQAMASPSLNEGELRQLVVTAEMFGHQLSDTSNADICFVLGGC